MKDKISQIKDIFYLRKFFKNALNPTYYGRK